MGSLASNFEDRAGSITVRTWTLGSKEVRKSNGLRVWQSVEAMSYVHHASKRATSSAPTTKSPAKVTSADIYIRDPDDSFEREADHMADKVTSGSTTKPEWSLRTISIAPSLQHKCSCGGIASFYGECEECKKKAALQRKAADEISPTQTAPSIVHEVLQSPGQPLDPSTRSFMESRFRRDFSHVRVHTGARADEAARSVSALAFTVYGDHEKEGSTQESMTAREAPRGASWDFSKIALHAAARVSQPQSPSPQATSPLPGAIQAKLVVGQAGDPLEHEANRVADQVMRMPDAQLSITSVAPKLSRKCSACQGEEGKVSQPNLVGPAKIPADDAPGILRDALYSPGRPLDAFARAFFEPRFRADFSRVRIHTGPIAAESARAVNALAYTAGPDIVFREGQSDTGTVPGKRLLAHELAHVVQQSHAKPLQPTHIPQQAKSEESPVDKCGPKSALSPMKLTTEQMPRLFRQEDVNMGSLGPSNQDAASDEGQNRETDVEWMPQVSADAKFSDVAGRSSDQLSGGLPTTSASPEITLESGNNTGSPLNRLLHQQVCVVPGFERRKDCHSFAAIGVQLPQFSSTWLGWNSKVVGAVLKGEVYNVDAVPGATVVSRLTPTAVQASKWNSYMLNRRSGLQDGYSVARHNCRTFSQWEFRDAPSHW